MKKSILFALLVLVGLLLASCNSATPEPTATAVPPPEEPAAEPTAVEEPTQESAPPVETPDPSALSANPWQWVSFTSPVEQFDVEMPDAYLLNFAEDGMLNIVADCNNASGGYTADGSSLTIEVGPMTKAACPPESRSDQFVSLLGGAAIYFFEDGNLYIDLLADGGTLMFAPASAEAMADDGEGAMAGALWANPWQWVSFTNPVEQFEVEMPESYQLTFNEDGTLNVVADCNKALGSYTDDAGALTIEFGPMTLVACPEDSRGDQFVQLLMGAARYFFEEGNLYIDLMADGGTMMFTPASADAMEDDGQGAMDGALPEDVVAQLDAYLQSQVYADGGNPHGTAPGLVLYVETPDGVYLNAAGVSNLEDGTPMQTADILEIGSNTKSMTIVLLMQLVEEGLISLDDPLSQYLPDQAALLPNGDQVTIRQMAQHTAGFYDYGDNIIADGLSGPAALEMGFAPAELVQDAVDNGTPYFAPGEEGQWHYSNTGYILLGMIIESLTGEMYGDLMQTRIFDPLGMESAVLLEGVPQEGEITTHGYWWQGDEIIDTTNWNASQGWAAGAAAMTAADLATYGKALAAGELFQNPDTLNEMLTFDPAAISMLNTPYGLGLFDVAGDGSVWGHAGQTLGFQSLWFIDPENGIVVVGLTNSAAYDSAGLVNVRSILAGNGPLPVNSGTLLPGAAPTAWHWTQFVTPVEATEIDEPENFQILLTAEQGVLFINPDCGTAVGTYTVEGLGQINFDLDTSSLTCDADSLGGQLAQHLNDAVSWYFDNGMLVIELPADGGTLVFTSG